MALKSLFAAGLFAAVVAFFPGAPAEAKNVITINIGTGAPGWDHHCHNRRGWRCGWNPGLRRYFYIAPGRPLVYYDYRPPVINRISCGRAHNIVETHGFNRVSNRDCSGKYYAFTGRKKGHRYLVSVNSYTGRIVGTRRY